MQFPVKKTARHSEIYRGVVRAKGVDKRGRLGPHGRGRPPAGRKVWQSGKKSYEKDGKHSISYRFVSTRNGSLRHSLRLNRKE